MTSTTTVCMEESPTERYERGQQPPAGASPITLQVDFSASEWSHRERYPPQVPSTSPEAEIYEVHGAAREGMVNFPSSRNSQLDYNLTSLNLKDENPAFPVFSNGTLIDSGNGFITDSPSQPNAKGISLVQAKSENTTKLVTLVPPASSTHSSNFKRFIMNPSSSSSESSPSPPPPPARPPPGPGPGPGHQKGFSAQLPELYQHSRAEQARSPPVHFLEPKQMSPVRKLFSAQSSQRLHSRSRTRQPQHKESHNEILERAKLLRAEIWGLRSRILEKRTFLREVEYAKSVADDKYMKFIRTHDFPNLSLSDKLKAEQTLLKLFGECERLRNEYGPLEDDCNILETILNNGEYEMQKLEAALDKRWKQAPRINQESESPESSAPASNYSTSEFSQNFHPLVTKYLSKLGDVEIFRERVDWHRDEKLTLEEEKETKERVQLKLAEADQEWLDNYVEAELALLGQLKEAEREAERLRAQCFSLGLVDEDGEPLDFEEQERQKFIADEVDAGTEKSDFVKFPLLLPVPGNKDTEISDLLPSTENSEDKEEEGGNIQKRIDPNDRINHWLLQTLRSSPLDVNLLVRTFEAWFGHIIEGERWQIDVLRVWYNDGSKEMATEYSRSLSEVVTHSRQKTVEQPTGRPSIGATMMSSIPRPANWEEESVVKGKDSRLLAPTSIIVRKDEGIGV
jgi:hypothetical protein